MTKAVCFRCGEIKSGAFNRCGICGALPRSDDELTMSLAFNEHYFDWDTLLKIGNNIKMGNPPRLDEAIRAKLLPGVNEAKKMIGIDRVSKQKHSRRRKSIFNFNKLRQLFLLSGSRETPIGRRHSPKAASETNFNENTNAHDKCADPRPETPLTLFCVGISTPETLTEFLNSNARELKIDTRAWLLSIVIMSAAGHFVRGLSDPDNPTAIKVKECLGDVNFDAITAETMVWISFLLGRLWNADQKNDREMFEAIGFTTFHSANRLALEWIKHLTRYDYESRWKENRCYYFDMLKKRGDLHESFATVLFLSANRCSLQSPLRVVDSADYFAPEWPHFVLYVTTFFSTMPQGYYNTFKNMLRAWADSSHDNL